MIQISRKAYENILYIIHPFSFKATFGLSLTTTCNPLLFAYYIYEIKEDFASVIKRTSSTFSNALQNPLILHIFMPLKWKHRHQKYSGLFFVFQRFEIVAYNTERMRWYMNYDVWGFDMLNICSILLYCVMLCFFCQLTSKMSNFQPK